MQQTGSKKVQGDPLCKRLKSNNTNKWYLHKPKSVRKNKTCEILWFLRYKRIP